MHDGLVFIKVFMCWRNPVWEIDVFSASLQKFRRTLLSQTWQGYIYNYVLKFMLNLSMETTYNLSIFHNGRKTKLRSWLISLIIMKQLKHCYWVLFKMVLSGFVIGKNDDLVVKTRPLHTITTFLGGRGALERGEVILLETVLGFLGKLFNKDRVFLTFQAVIGYVCVYR